MTPPTTRVATVNLFYGLPPAAFRIGLTEVLRDKPDVVVIQEAGTARDAVIQQVATLYGYEWARAPGGGPVMWVRNLYTLRSCTAVRLAGREFVGHLPGRKSRLPASIATAIVLADEVAGGDRAVLDFHLTAEIQDMQTGGYKRDLAHRLRVMRHKRERRRLGRRGRMQQRRGRTVYPAGDGNFHGMTLRGFRNSWTNQSFGTLGPRQVDIVFAATKPFQLWTVETPSDHDALVVTYKETEG